LVYWHGECPVHDITLSKAAGILVLPQLEMEEAFFR
jgi:hypothetical protein